MSLECLEAHRGNCQGPVEYHSITMIPGEAYPRCDKHWEERLDRRENSIELYADSDGISSCRKCGRTPQWSVIGS